MRAAVRFTLEELADVAPGRAVESRVQPDSAVPAPDHGTAEAPPRNLAHQGGVELLGHADIRLTGDVYGHVSTETAKAAMQSLSRALGY